MKRPLRFRPALECLEDRCCPSLLYNVNGGPFIPPPQSVNAVNGALGLADNASFPMVAITYEASTLGSSQEYQVVDGGTYYFTGVTSLSVTLGGIQDTLDVNGNEAALGTGSPMPGYVSVALDGTAPSAAQPNIFTFENAYLNVNNNPSISTLYVLDQGGYNNVQIGNGSSFTDVVAYNQLNRNAANGPNPGTLNDSNNTNFDAFWVNTLVYNSQSASAIDTVIAGSSSGGFYEYGPAAFSFNSNNNFTMSVANGFVGSVYEPNSQFTVLGGGSDSSLILGDGVTSLAIPDAAVFDLDNTSGGMLTVNDNVALQSTTRFDDYQTINIDTGGGANGVNVGQGLTIWNSDAGSNVTLGTGGVTITGNVTFDTGRIAGDTGDPGSSASASDTLTLSPGAILNGNLSATLNTSQDTIDVGGVVTKKFTVTASNDNVGVMVDATGRIDGSASIALGGNGAKQFYFDGSVGSGSPSTTVLTVTSASNSSVVAEIGNDAQVFGGVTLSLAQSSDIVSYDEFASITGTLFAFGNGPATSTFFANGHTAGSGSGHYMETGFTVVP